MLLKRKIYRQLLDWKSESAGTSAVLINGARRVGKSFICKQFGENEYKSMILIDFSKPSSVIKDIFENAQMLRANGHRLFFYSRTDASYSKKTIEIDFLINTGSTVCPIEVKSSAYRAHSSLDKFKTKFSGKIGESYILYTKDVMIKEGVVHLPVYMASLL